MGETTQYKFKCHSQQHPAKSDGNRLLHTSDIQIWEYEPDIHRAENDECNGR